MTYINNTGIYGNASQTTPADAPKGLNVNGTSVIDDTGSVLAQRVKGNTAGTAPSSGNIGETIVVSQASLVNYTQTTNLYGNVLTINSAALGGKTGTFLLFGECNVTPNGAGGFSFDYITISDFSNNDTTDDSFIVNRWSVPSDSLGRIMGFTVNVTASSTKYIKVRVAYSSGTPQYRYSFRFVRIA